MSLPGILCLWDNVKHWKGRANHLEALGIIPVGLVLADPGCSFCFFLSWSIHSTPHHTSFSSFKVNFICKWHSPLAPMGLEIPLVLFLHCFFLRMGTKENNIITTILSKEGQRPWCPFLKDICMLSLRKKKQHLRIPCWKFLCIGILSVLSLFLPKYVRAELSLSYPKESHTRTSWVKDTIRFGRS